MRKNRNTGAVVTLVVLASLSALAGCDRASSDSIERWKGTEKGPGKLMDTLKDASVAPELRAQAALALVEIHQIDEVEGALAGLPAADRTRVVSAIVPLTTSKLEHPSSPTAAADARDLLVTARAEAPPEMKGSIDQTLVRVTEEDLKAGRRIAGRHSLQKMVTEMGASAGPMLARALESPNASYVEIADLLAKVGDEASRERGGAALVKRAQTMRPMPPAMWRAIGSVGGKAGVTFLRGKIEQGGSEAIEAARAVQARREPELLPMALALAGNPKTDRAVREEMFGLAEVIGGAAARDGLVKIIASDKEELVRYRAYEAALAADKAGAIGPALEAMPTTASYKPEDVQDYLVKDIQKIGPAAREATLKVLASKSPVARMTAVWALEAVGSRDDGAALQKLAGDKGAPKGFPAGKTVGQEAARIAAALAGKKS